MGQKPDLAEWMKLEREVATHYEALGYAVTLNINISGHQVDILARKFIEGGTSVTLMIEVKYRAKGTVGVEDVTKFYNTAHHLLSAFAITNAVLVTNTGFSQDAHKIVEGRQSLQLTTVAKLEQDIFSYSESLIKIVSDHEADAISDEYVPLAGHSTNGLRTANIVDFCLSWAERKQPLLLLLGDFGSGKTTAMGRIRYAQSRRRIGDAGQLYPVLLRLRSLLHASDLWQFISQELRDNQYISPTRATFDAQLKAGRLLILLDGFDEIYTGASAQDRGRYLAHLSPLLTSPSPCIISTRPTYFESFEDLTKSFQAEMKVKPALGKGSFDVVDVQALLRALDMPIATKFEKANLENALFISQLDEAQIIAFLEKHATRLHVVTGRGIGEVKAYLDRIYDLEDLMTRPLLLKMIVETILSSKVDITDDEAKVGPAKLYDIYTRLCAVRDRDRSPDFLTSDDRLRASRSIAMEMLEHGSIELKIDQVKAAIRKGGLVTGPRAKDPLTFDKILADIRVCSFLSLSDDGSLRFTHKSFFEFFVAQEVYLRASKTPAELRDPMLRERRLSKEILYFLGSFARDEEDFGRLVTRAVRENARAGTEVYDFLGRLICASGTLLGKVHLVGCAIAEVDVRRLELTAGYLRECSLTEVSLRRVRALHWEMHDCVVADSQVLESSFTGGSLALDLQATSLASVRFTRLTLHIQGGAWKAESCDFDDVSMDLDGQGRLINCGLTNADLTLKKGLELGQGSSINVRKSRVLAQCGPDWRGGEIKVRFIGCELAGLWITLADLTDRNSSRDGLSFDDCTGVVRIHDMHGSGLEDRIAAFAVKHPRLLVVDQRALEVEYNTVKGGRTAASSTSVLGQLRKKAEQSGWSSKLIDAGLGAFL